MNRPFNSQSNTVFDSIALLLNIIRMVTHLRIFLGGIFLVLLFVSKWRELSAALCSQVVMKIDNYPN